MVDVNSNGDAVVDVGTRANGSPIYARAGVQIGAAYVASGIAPLTDSLSASGSSEIYTPLAGRDFYVDLSGTWVGTAFLSRAAPNSTTFLPIKVEDLQLCLFTTNGSRVWSESENGAQYRIEFTRTSGTLDVRFGQ